MIELKEEEHRAADTSDDNFRKDPTHTHSLIDGVVSPELTSRSAHNSGGGKGSSSSNSHGGSQRICVLFFLEEPLGL